jgi:predicted nucleotidyltransferase
MRTLNAGHRAELLEATVQFVRAVVALPGVRRVSLLGSMVTMKTDPKDIDLLVEIADDSDLATLAAHARRLHGRAQQLNRGADVFLVDARGTYLGRTCHWRDCRPGLRASCDALHCGSRPHLHDDLDTIRLEPHVVAAPPVTLWPDVVRRVGLPPDVEHVVEKLEHGV